MTEKWVIHCCDHLLRLDSIFKTTNNNNLFKKYLKNMIKWLYPEMHSGLAMIIHKNDDV